MTKMIFPILALFVGVIFVLLPFIFKLNNEKEIEKYNYLKFFPFEIPYSASTRLIFVIVSGLFTLLCAETYVSNLLTVSTNFGMISALILFVISDIALFCSLCFSLEYYRYHIVADVVSFLTHIGGGATLLITCVSSELHIEFITWISIVIGVLSFIELLLLFIPKLKKWMYLEKSELNGKVTYIRPKYCILGIVEWIFIAFEIINMLLILINSLLLL